MSTSSTIYKHYLRIISLWPKDNYRPQLQLRDVLQRRADRRFLPAPATTTSATATSSSSQASTAAAAVAVATTSESDSTSSTTTPQSRDADEATELNQINALYSLLEGRYEKKYPLPPTNTLLTPASNPTHYSDLVRELEEAPTRRFWAKLSHQWRGMLRFK